MKTSLIAIACAVACGAAQAAVVAPTISGSLRVTGTVTVDSGASSDSQILNFNNSNHNRFNVEYDLSGTGGDQIVSASFTTDIRAFQSTFDQNPVYEVLAYAGDGQLNFGDDWDPSGAISLGTQQLNVFSGNPDTISLADIQQAVQSIVDGGADFLGIQIRVIQNGRSRNQAVNTVLNIEAIPAPGSLSALALSALAFRRRR